MFKMVWLCGLARVTRFVEVLGRWGTDLQVCVHSGAGLETRTTNVQRIGTPELRGRAK